MQPQINLTTSDTFINTADELNVLDNMFHFTDKELTDNSNTQPDTMLTLIASQFTNINEYFTMNQLVNNIMQHISQYPELFSGIKEQVIAEFTADKLAAVKEQISNKNSVDYHTSNSDKHNNQLADNEELRLALFDLKEKFAANVAAGKLTAVKDHVAADKHANAQNLLSEIVNDIITELKADIFMDMPPELLPELLANLTLTQPDSMTSNYSDSATSYAAAPRSSTTSSSGTTTTTDWLTATDNVLIKLMLVILTIFEECMESLAIRGSDLSTVQESITTINDSLVVFANLSVAFALIDNNGSVATTTGITTDGTIDSIDEIFKYAAHGENVSKNMYPVVEPVARAMGMTITQGSPANSTATPPIAATAGSIYAVDPVTGLATGTALTTDQITDKANAYFKNLNKQLEEVGANKLTTSTISTGTPAASHLVMTKSISDRFYAELNNAALYAGNISQTTIQEMKILQDFLSIYMQAASSYNSTNKEANQAVFR